MLPKNGWIHECTYCKIPTSHQVVFILHSFTTYLCKNCSPIGEQYTPHLRFSTKNPKIPEN